MLYNTTLLFLSTFMRVCVYARAEGGTRSAQSLWNFCFVEDIHAKRGRIAATKSEKVRSSLSDLSRKHPPPLIKTTNIHF